MYISAIFTSTFIIIIIPLCPTIILSSCESAPLIKAALNNCINTSPTCLYFAYLSSILFVTFNSNPQKAGKCEEVWSRPIDIALMVGLDTPNQRRIFRPALQSFVTPNQVRIFQVKRFPQGSGYTIIIQLNNLPPPLHEEWNFQIVVLFVGLLRRPSVCITCTPYVQSLICCF